MLYELIPSISLRTIYSLITAFFILLALGPWVISRLQEKRIGQNVREEGVKAHLEKKGIPTMGGIMIVVSVFVATGFWGRPTSSVLLVLLTFLWMGFIGFLDDFLKTVRGKSAGLSARQKLGMQTGFSLIAALWIFDQSHIQKTLFVPGLNQSFELGYWYILLVVLTVVGSSNAVNLTDGLDGLASGVMFIVIGCMGIVAYLAGNAIYSRHLAIPHVLEGGELTIFCFAIVGACLGFLWFNAKPASVFMGDTGSLALGGSLGMVAVLVKAEIFLVIVGGIFVIEALSVMIQVGSYRLRGKRVFKMAPIHHHFELLGWPETKVVIRFWIVTLVLALLGMSLLGINGRFF